MQQSQKVDGFEFAVLQGNLKEWHERPWNYMYVCRCLRKATKVGLTVSVSGTVHWLYPILPFGIVPCKFFVTTSLEIVCINGISQALASSLIQYPYPVVQTAEFRVGHDMFLCLRPKFKTQVIYFIYIFIFSFSNLTSVGWFSKFPQKGKMASEPQHTVIVTNPKRSRQGLFIIMFDLEFTWAWKCCVIIFNFFLE